MSVAPDAPQRGATLVVANSWAGLTLGVWALTKGDVSTTRSTKNVFAVVHRRGRFGKGATGDSP